MSAALGFTARPCLRLRPRAALMLRLWHTTSRLGAPGRPTAQARAGSQPAAAVSQAAGGQQLQQQRAPAGTVPRVILKGGKSKLFSEFQSPTVYGGAVDRVVGRPAPKAGDVVLVCDGAEQPLGWGVYNPNSMFRVRMMQLAEEVSAAELQQPSLERLLQERLWQAVELRRSLGLPSPATNVYRLCNSEGDRLSGLVVDALGDHLVVASSAAWVERHRECITAALRQLTRIGTIVWRPSLDMLREEGWLVGQQPQGEAGIEGANSSSGSSSSSGSNGEHAVGAGDEGSREEEGAEQSRPSPSSSGGSDGGGSSASVVVLENGIKYAASPLGQKTGFYADQRDSRAVVRSLAAAAAQGAGGGCGSARMLDMCCFSGGFAVNAAVGGAAEVVGVDSSAAALALAERNAELNNVAQRCSFLRADVAEFMKQAVAEGRQWDLVVFDPPKLAPNRKSLPRAMHKYRRLNAQALRLVAPGGLLMTCSCSGAMSQSGEFVPMLQAAAREAGRRIVLLREAGAAPDHTLDPAYPEGRYLTNVLLRVL